jgi:hypothetical protein
VIVSCINLERRTDRWARCQQIAVETGLTIVRAHAPDMPGRGWVACSWAHQLAVLEAKHRGDEFVIVAEDDFEPSPLFTIEHFQSLIRLANTLGLGALYAGTVSYPEEVVAVHEGVIVETTTYLSSHLTVYFARAYEAVLHWPCGWGSDFGRNPMIGSDPTGRMAMTPPIFMRRGLCVPFLAIQRDDFSDNCGQELKLADNWKRAEQAWSSAVRLIHS